MKFRMLLSVLLGIGVSEVCEAGFLDGLKSVGKGLGDMATGIADGARNFTTSAVQKVSSVSLTYACISAHDASSSGSMATNAHNCVIGMNQSAEDTIGSGGIRSKSLRQTQDESGHRVEQSHADNRPIDAAHLRKYMDEEVKPRLAVFRQALESHQKAYSGTHWNDSFFCERDPNEFADVLIPILFERGVAVSFGDNSYYSLEGEAYEIKKRLVEEYAKPWNATYLGREKYSDYYACSISKDKNCVCESMHDPQSGKELHGGQINKKSMGEWKAKMSKWLAAEELKLRDLLLFEGEGPKLFAKEHGDPTYKPFAAFKDIQLGDSVEDVYAKLNAISPGFRWGKPYSEVGCGEVIGDYLRGKTFQAYLPHHLLTLRFGAFKEMQGSALVSVKINFVTPPTEEMMVAKYKAMPGAEVKKIKMEVSRKWKDDDAGRFCKAFADRLVEQAGKQSDAQAESRLRADVEAIKNRFSTADTCDITVVTVNGVDISLRCKKGTDTILEVNIIDKIVSDVMMRKLAEVKQKRQEMAVKMKEDNKKAALKSASDF